MGKIQEKIKSIIRDYLNVKENQFNNRGIMIRPTDSRQVIFWKNEMWYRGKASELQQFYTQYDDGVASVSFWAIPQPSVPVRKIHTGLPALIIDLIINVIVDSIDEISVKRDEVDKNGRQLTDFEATERWNIIEKEHDFKNSTLKDILRYASWGDMAIKYTYDETISKYPIINCVKGKYVSYTYASGRIKEINFYIPKELEDGKIFVLEEKYTKGYSQENKSTITYKLYDEDGREIPSRQAKSDIKKIFGIEDVEYNHNIMLATQVIFEKSSVSYGRGKGWLEDKEGAFDSLDETWSQWIGALRAGRTDTFIPEDYLRRDKENGSLLKPNPLTSIFIAYKKGMKEGVKDDGIVRVAADILASQYNETYITALELCLQGILSPSTLGIDVKKLDNAEAQREKEKTTLYTIKKIIRKLESLLPNIVETTLKFDDAINNRAYREYTVSVVFGEYANPSFEAVIETMAKGRDSGVISIEQSVEEIWGDTKTPQEKLEEIALLKAEKNDSFFQDLNEPAVNETLSLTDEEIEENGINNG